MRERERKIRGRIECLYVSTHTLMHVHTVCMWWWGGVSWGANSVGWVFYFLETPPYVGLCTNPERYVGEGNKLNPCPPGVCILTGNQRLNNSLQRKILL